MKKVVDYSVGVLVACAFGIQFLSTGYSLTLNNDKGEPTINISAEGYEPKSLTVSKGTTVSWYNAEPGAAHSATADDGSFDTTEMWPGATAFITFDMAPGVYRYHCMKHEKEETGEIIVVD